MKPFHFKFKATKVPDVAANAASVRAMLALSGLDASVLAGRIGVTKSAMSRILSGERSLDETRFAKIKNVISS